MCIRDSHHTATSRNELAERILGHLKNGKLTLEGFEAAMIGIEEASSKRTFLFRIPHGPADLARIDKQLSDLKVPLSHQRIRASNPVPVPKVVYAINTPEELRIKWTEQHKRVIAVRKTRSWDEKNIPKIIVLIVNKATGVVQLRCDSPEDEPR